MRNRIRFLFCIYASAAALSISGCYPIGEGGAVFFMCSDCVAPELIYIYVDGEKIGEIDQKYSVYCGQTCRKSDSPTFTGEDGEHIYTVKNASGSVLAEETFTINKRKCSEIVIKPQGCISASGGGGGNCSYTTYTFSGALGCNAGDVRVGTNNCCDASTPYWCPNDNSCHATCNEAAAHCNGSVILGTSTPINVGNCNYTTYTGSGNCSSGNVLVASGVCCPSSTPYYCSNTNKCYATCSAAAANCSGNVKFGNSSGSGNSCSFSTWRTFLSVVSTTRDPLGIGNNNELEVVVRNNSNEDMDIRICLHTIDGDWDCGLEYCISPGGTADYMKFTSVYTDLYQYYGRPCGNNCQFPDPG
ncbi:MAG TPA: hypothetical protein VNJ07_09495 [Chitinophagales bacterium]|nr:hypothetical protein [Chitinophagales bacterium]